MTLCVPYSDSCFLIPCMSEKKTGLLFLFVIEQRQEQAKNGVGAQRSELLQFNIPTRQFEKFRLKPELQRTADTFLFILRARIVCVHSTEIMHHLSKRMCVCERTA